MKQLIKSATREQTFPDGKKSSTLIDQFWVKPTKVHRFRTKVHDISDYGITDHHLVRISTDLKQPPVKLSVPREVDRFRRYQNNSKRPRFAKKLIFSKHKFGLLRIVSGFDAFRRKCTLFVDFNKNRRKSTPFVENTRFSSIFTKYVDFQRFLLKSTKTVCLRRKASKKLTVQRYMGLKCAF